MAETATVVALNGASTEEVATLERLAAVINQRLAPVKFEIPDYDLTVEVQMLRSGDQEHCQDYAQKEDGTRNVELYVRIYVGYALVSPLLAKDRNRRIQAEKVAALLEEYPSDFYAPIFSRAWDLTNEYQLRRAEREKQNSESGNVFPSSDSAPSSSQTD
jgi:hypothetical protein